MIVESVAIFGITLCILAVFVRSDNADYAMATTPLLIVPAANLLGLPIAKLVNGLLPGNQLYLVRCFADVLGVAAACGLIVLFSGKIKNRKKSSSISGCVPSTACAQLRFHLQFRFPKF